MKIIASFLLAGSLALGLSACGNGTTTPGNFGSGNTGGGPRINGSTSTGVTAKPGDKLTIISYLFDKPVKSISGSPVFIFSGYKGTTATAQRTAPCELVEQLLACSYIVKTSDVGEASDGIVFNSTEGSTSGFQPQGASVTGTDGKSATLRYTNEESGITATKFILGSVRF